MTKPDSVQDEQATNAVLLCKQVHLQTCHIMVTIDGATFAEMGEVEFRLRYSRILFDRIAEQGSRAEKILRDNGMTEMAFIVGDIAHWIPLDVLAKRMEQNQRNRHNTQAEPS
jgi:hypothetical protein